GAPPALPPSINGAPPRVPSYGPPGEPAQSRPATSAPRFPTTMQLLAVVIAAVVLGAGMGIYVFRSHGTTAAPPAARGDAIAVVRDGPAVLTSQSLAGGAAGKSLNIPGSPVSIVTTPDGSKGF